MGQAGGFRCILSYTHLDEPQPCSAFSCTLPPGGQEEKIPAPESGEVLVRASVSAISPGTEMLVYRGEFPQDISTNSSISELASQFTYPLKYGYCLVGEVLEAGKGVDRSWIGRRVFVFHPHQSLFLARPSELIPVPEDLSDEQAVLLPNTETAVNFVMDGKPVIGERVLVLGQGVVGLLTAALLARFPLECLVTLDRFPLRRNASRQVGAHHSLDPLEEDLVSRIKRHLASRCGSGIRAVGFPTGTGHGDRLHWLRRPRCHWAPGMGARDLTSTWEGGFIAAVSAWSAAR